MYFFSIILSILIGLPGLILFALGLINKKPGQWIAGIVMTFIALLVLIFSLVMLVHRSVTFLNKTIQKEIGHPYSHNYNYDMYPEDKTYRDTTEETVQITDELYDDKGVSGFIKGVDNKLTLIHVKINNQLEIKGVTIDKIEDYTPQSIKRNGILLKLNFMDDFKSNLTLTAYNADNNEISCSSLIFFAKKGEQKNVEFDFTKDINLSDINYCILTEYIK